MESRNEKPHLFAAEIQLFYKTQIKPSERPRISCSQDSYRVLLNSWDPEQIEFVEQFKVLLLNRAHRVLGFVLVSSGCNSGTVVDPKLVFAAALKTNACSVIVAHNHPSGNLAPSQADLTLTRKLHEGAKILEIQFLDHLILTKEGYFSFADEGLL